MYADILTQSSDYKCLHSQSKWFQVFMNGSGRQYQHLIWQRDEPQPVVNENMLSGESQGRMRAHSLFKPQTWAEQCMQA